MTRGWSRARFLATMRAWLIISVTLVIVAIIVTQFGDRSAARVTTNFFILLGLVIALQSFTGNSGIISFGHVAFYGVGAYTAALLTIPPRVKQSALPNLPPFLLEAETDLVVAALAGAAAAILVALLIGIALARMREQAMAMATLALLVTMHTVFANWEAMTRGTIGIYGIPRHVDIWIALAGAILIAGSAFLFKASPVGLHLQAAREDPLAAQALGINLSQVRLAGWLVSAGLMGAGGALWAQNSLAFGPDQFFFAETFKLLSILVIGGLFSVTGAITGAAVVTVISELLRDLEAGFVIGPLAVPELPGLTQLAVAVMILLILIYRPEGLVGAREIDIDNRTWLRRRKNGD